MSTADLSPAQLAVLPALKPPVGVTPDFTTEYIDLQPAFLAFGSIWLALTTIIVAARLVAKAFVSKIIQVEDYVVILGWLGYVGWISFTLWVCHKGLGRHQWDTTALQMLKVAELIDYSEIFYCPVVFVSKLALLLQYKRIFVPSKRGIIYIGIHILIWSNLIVYLFVFFWLIFACIPREKIWNPTVPGHCLNPEANSIFSASWNMVSDFTILALPLFSIWSLRLPIKRKAGVSVIFTVGLIGCAASIGRMVYGVRLLHASDVNFVIAQNGIWSFTEVAMILICSSLPLLPKFLQLIIPTNTHSKRTSSPSVYQQNLRDHYAKPYNSQSTKNKSKTLPSLPVSSFSHTGIDTHREGSEDSYLPLTNKERGGVGVKVSAGWDKDVDVDVEKMAGEKAIVKTVRLERDGSSL